MKINFRNKRKIAGLLFILPSFAGIMVFYLIPYIDVIRRSFMSAMGGKFVGLKNYQTVFNNEAFRIAALNTLRFTFICIPLLLVISLILSVMLSDIKKLGNFLKSSYLLPLAVPVASAAMLWKILFYDKGIINSFLVSAGADPVSWLNGDTSFIVLSISYLWKNIGYDMILWLSGISQISKSVIEAAELDGCKGIKKLFYIILPEIKGTAFTVTILSLINSFKVFREIYLVAGDYPDKNIYMLQNLFNNWFVSLDIQKMSAGAVILSVFIIGLIALIRKAFLKNGDGSII